MAPDLLGPPSKKRRLSADGSASAETSRTVSVSSSQIPAKRRKLPPLARQYVTEGTASVLPAEVIESLFEQSIALVLKSCGIQGGSRILLNQIKQQAAQFMQDITTDALKYSVTQRRTRPTITDFEETLHKTGYTAADLEDEVIRYRKASVRSNKSSKPKPHIYTLPSPAPELSTEPPLQDLLGPELLEPRKRYKLPTPIRPQYLAQLEKDNPNNPKLSLQSKPTTSYITERPYIDTHHPQFPSKHTYQHNDEYSEHSRDAKKIRELASEEARQSGETLRKLLADFSKVSTTRKITGGENGRNGYEVYKGGNARKERDTMFEKTWDAVIKAAEQEKENEKRVLEEKRKQRKDAKKNKPVNGLFSGNMMDLDEESSSDESEEEEEMAPEIDEKGLLDTVVNCEKSLWTKGGMRRVMIR